MDKLPSAPVLLSGAFGGPFVIFTCTPLRNALTLGAQDRHSGVIKLLRKVFRGGPQAGWTGGFAPAIVACPQFMALGPVYHTLNGTFRRNLFPGSEGGGHAFLPSLMACCGAAICETCLTYGSQSRNAQMAYNNSMVLFSSVEEGARVRLKLNKMTRIYGPGAGPAYFRNLLSIASVRAISPCVRERVQLPGVGDSTKAVLCDMSCSVMVSTMTAPLHQLFNFMVTTPQAGTLPRRERWNLAIGFLKQQYLVPKPREDFMKPQEYTSRISKIAFRDFVMRTSYVTAVFTMYMAIERTLVGIMRR
mmetsp:Transcript_17861/g.50364  ORF Transcript_17861/g.50364 Transcript_17861/m.50364 type:complete len:304 (+) Transcript_17861:131-1042(+)